MLVQAYSKQFKINSIIIRPFSIMDNMKIALGSCQIYLDTLKSKKLTMYDGYTIMYINDLISF